ncbi:MAG: hypothetical protein P8188_16510 [Gemmatimonadota bacterium]
MTDERRYDEDQIAEIFRRATQEAGRARLRPGDAESSPPAGGLTLDELQEIGREVGIDPAAVRRGAAALDRVSGGPGQVTRRAAFSPLAVARTTPLARPLTDQEWTRVVLDLRETFDARGTIQAQGGFREWTNGNLQAMLEPTPEGERFRIRSRKSAGEVPIIGGLFMVTLAVVVALITLATGTPLAEVLRETGILTALGGLGFVVGSASLKRWADTRQSQMAAVSERVALLAATPPATPEEHPPGND